jgi:hypothetical protein
MTSSARTRTPVGHVMPSDSAVFRLMLSIKLVACCTGRVAGLVALEDMPGIDACRPRPLRNVRLITHEAANQREIARRRDSRHAVAQ